MNNLMIVGNLTNDPVTTNRSGYEVTNFTVAVNRKNKPAVFVRATAWGKAGETIAKYSGKGKKILLAGEASASAYVANDGTAKATLELNVNSFEFLSPGSDVAETDAPRVRATSSLGARCEAMLADTDPYNTPVASFTDVTDDDNDLPF